MFLYTTEFLRLLHSIIVAKVIDTLALKPILPMTTYIAFQIVQVLGD